MSPSSNRPNRHPVLHHAGIGQVPAACLWPTCPVNEVANTPQDFLPLLVIVVVALAVAGIVIVLSVILGPRRELEAKSEAYESGIRPFADTRRRFPVQYYLIAVLFIIFDIEVVFLYPWATTLHNDALKKVSLAAMGVFMAIVVIGFVYEWRKGALDWD